MTANVQYDAQNLREFMARVEDFMGAHKAPLRRVDFANLVTNGTFDADSDWTKGTGWTIGSGVASASAAAGTQMYQTSVFPIAGHYLAGFEIVSYSAGTLFIGHEENVNLQGSFSSVGVHSAAITTSPTQTDFYLSGTGGGLTATIDNISIWEADPSDDAPWLRLPFGHKVGKRGLVVRDSSVLHPGDYEEMTDSGQTFIKPKSAPGAATEFSVFCAPEG